MRATIICVNLTSVDDGRAVELELRVWRSGARPSRSYAVRTPLRVERALCLVTAHHRRALRAQRTRRPEIFGTAPYNQVTP